MNVKWKLFYLSVSGEKNGMKKWQHFADAFQ